jgi:hypothetical protein
LRLASLKGNPASPLARKALEGRGGGRPALITHRGAGTSSDMKPASPSASSLTVAATLLALLAGCGSPPSSAAPGSHYVGGMAGVSTSGIAGAFSFDIAGANAFLDSGPAGTVDVSGEWTSGGTSTTLLGTYTGSTKLLSVLGTRGGTSYNLVNDPPIGPATRLVGGVFGGTWQGAWSAVELGAGVTGSVLCGMGFGAGLNEVALVLGSDGTASMALHFQTIPVTMPLTRTGDALSGSLFGYTFAATLSSTGKTVSGTVTNGTTSGTWVAGVDGC